MSIDLIKIKGSDLEKDIYGMRHGRPALYHCWNRHEATSDSGDTRGHLRTPFPESYLLNFIGKYGDVHYLFTREQASIFVKNLKKK